MSRKAEKRFIVSVFESTFCKKVDLHALDKRERWVRSFDFCAKSECFKKNFLRLLMPNMLTPNVAMLPQSIAKKKARSMVEPRYRKKHKKKTDVSTNVKIKSEIKAVFFMVKFLPSFLHYKLEKSKKILYNR